MKCQYLELWETSIKLRDIHGFEISKVVSRFQFSENSNYIYTVRHSFHNIHTANFSSTLKENECQRISCLLSSWIYKCIFIILFMYLIFDLNGNAHLCTLDFHCWTGNNTGVIIKEPMTLEPERDIFWHLKYIRHYINIQNTFFKFNGKILINNFIHRLSF